MENEGTQLLSNEPVSDVIRDAPDVIVFPPVLPLGTLLLSLSLGFLWPWPLLPASISPFWRAIAGSLVIVSGGSLAAWGRTTMMRAGTNVLPSRPALAIVTAGPFRFTRNPLYVGNTLAYLGLMLILNSAWQLLLFVPMVRVLRWGIIHREERYLETKFGEVYRAYKAKVPRWL